ncbi:MAG: tripartite tricarboxylate transporter substrate binding protein [Pseudomonadota bacterium]
MKFKTIAAAATLAFAIAAPAITSAQAQSYPFRDINTVVVWGAGGGTDSINRMIMAEMEKELPVSITVTNTTGGVAGSNGMTYALNQPADGYTMAGISESNVTAAVQGGWDKKFDVWHPFIVGGSPDLISVNADAPYKTLDELIAAAKANPGSIAAGASGAGSIHHLNLLALENGTGAKFKFVPYGGSGPAQEAAVSGEVQVIVTSLAEQQALIKGGQIRPLAMLVPEDGKLDDMSIPSAFTNYPDLSKYLPLKQAIGFALPAAAPDDAKEAVTAAFKKAMESDTVKEWAAKNYYDLSGQAGDEASATFSNLESNFAYTLKELGATTVDPESLGIAKP